MRCCHLTLCTVVLPLETIKKKKQINFEMYPSLFLAGVLFRNPHGWNEMNTSILFNTKQEGDLEKESLHFLLGRGEVECRTHFVHGTHTVYCSSKRKKIVYRTVPVPNFIRYRVTVLPCYRIYVGSTKKLTC